MCDLFATHINFVDTLVTHDGTLGKVQVLHHAADGMAKAHMHSRGVAAICEIDMQPFHYVWAWLQTKENNTANLKLALGTEKHSNKTAWAFFHELQQRCHLYINMCLTRERVTNRIGTYATPCQSGTHCAVSTSCLKHLKTNNHHQETVQCTSAEQTKLFGAYKPFVYISH